MLNFFVNIDYLNYIPEKGRTSDLYLEAHKKALKDRREVYGQQNPILDVKIMIAALPKRANFHSVLADELTRQGFQFEFDYTEGISIGEKRERMYKNCSAGYCIELDDDDFIAHDFSLKLERALASHNGVDVVVYNELVLIEDNPPTFTLWGLEFDIGKTADNMFIFSPGPKMCIKTKLARTISIPHINTGEDMAFREKIKPLLKTQTRLEGWCITYEWTSNGTATGSQAHQIGKW